MKGYLFLVFAILFLAINVSAQQLGDQTLDQLQKSPAGSNIIAFLQTINTTTVFNEQDIPKLFAASLIEKHGSKKLLGLLKDIKDNDGLIELYEANRVDMFSYELKALGLKHGDWLDIKLTLEQQPPYKINGIQGITISPIAPKVKSPMLKPDGAVKVMKRTPTVNSEKLEALDKWITERTANNQFSGVVLIAKDFKPVFQKAYGYASRRYKIPNQLDTKFRYASVGKIFTATAVLQLAEEGKLNLDDKLGKYLDLDKFKDSRTKDITIRQLLSHRSGWASYWGNEYYSKNRIQLRSVSDYMEFIKDIPLDFTPGTNSQYSNTGYVVLGALIESVAKMDYYDYIDQYIYQPAGMNNSGSFHIDQAVENLATGYTNINYKGERGAEGYPYENTLLSAPRGVPAGGSSSTVGDLLNYLEAVANNKIVNKKSEEFLRSDFGNRAKAGDFIFHNGGGAGQNAWVQADVGNGYSIIVLSNYDPPSGSKVVEQIGNILNLEIF